MKYDEFAFFNQQLAAMLRDGVPLEGALHRLSAEMQQGELRSELGRLGDDLKNGTPLKDALAVRKLPDFYKQMIGVGVQSNDLPGVLTMLADYYQRVDSTWTRLKGLMVYPLIVLVMAFCLSCFLTFVALHILNSTFADAMGLRLSPMFMVNLWAPPLLTGLLLMMALAIQCFPVLQRRLRWRIPAFKEAKLAQIAAAMGMMLKNGNHLGDALGIVREMEKGTVASDELATWHNRLAQGRGQFAEMAVPGTAFPPLFLWLIANAGEDLPSGFARTAEIYDSRANHRIEMFLYAALPLAILGLGIMLVSQIIPIIHSFVAMMNSLSN